MGWEVHRYPPSRESHRCAALCGCRPAASSPHRLHRRVRSMKHLIFGQYGYAKMQGRGRDDTVRRVVVIPIQIRSGHPDLGRYVNQFDASRPPQRLGPLPDRPLRRQLPAPLLQPEFPKSDRRNEKCALSLTDLAKDLQCSGGQTSSAVQPPQERMGVDYHGLRSSSRRTSQSSMGNGFKRSSSSTSAPGPGPDWYQARMSFAFHSRPTGRTSSTSRPRSVTMSGSPVRSTSRKYSSIRAFSSPFETIFTLFKKPSSQT